MARSKILIVICIISTGMLFTACGGSVRYSKADTVEISEAGEASNGPPPHAPAHGYRHKHRGGEELVYKSDIGVYVVVGYPDYYFNDDRYYRLNDASWEVSLSLDGKWKPVSKKKLPKGLREMKTCKKKK